MRVIYCSGIALRFFFGIGSMAEAIRVPLDALMSKIKPREGCSRGLLTPTMGRAQVGNYLLKVELPLQRLDLVVKGNECLVELLNALELSLNAEVELNLRLGT